MRRGTQEERENTLENTLDYGQFPVIGENDWFFPIEAAHRTVFSDIG